MQVKKTVKAREHSGASSLNLTIPAGIRRTYHIEPGDVFEVTVEKNGDEIILKYRRVYAIRK